MWDCVWNACFRRFLDVVNVTPGGDLGPVVVECSVRRALYAVVNALFYCRPEVCWQMPTVHRLSEFCLRCQKMPKDVVTNQVIHML
jgi:hypothetical protein